MKKTKRLLRRSVGGIMLMMAILLTQVPVPKAQASTSSDFRMDGNKLIKYAGTANTVSVPASVKVIGAEAFADCSFLTGVTIPKGVETIEYGAFADCKQLRRVDIPATVTKIGREAFSNCIQLNKVNLGKEVTEIEPGAFAGCTSLKSIEVNSENPNFTSLDGVLYDKTKTKIYTMCAGREKNKYNMPETVSRIDPYAFWKCKNMKEVVVSAALKEIPAYAFSSCAGLEKIVIPYSVKLIDMKAFENCTNLVLADIPLSVSSIHLTAFDGCNRLRIETEEGTVADAFQKKMDEKKDSISGNEAIADVEDTTTKDTTADEESKDTTSEIKDAIASNDSEDVLGKTIIVSGSAVVLINQSKPKVYGGESQTIKDDQNNEAREMPPTNQKSVLERAFYRNADLTAYKIEPTVTKIESFAFARSGLKTITIPDSVEEIGYAAFYHCDNLESIMIPPTVKDIAAQAFQKTIWMKNWEKNSMDEFLIVGDGVLIAYKGNSPEVILPEQVKVVAGETFAGHEEIKKVTIPSTTTKIGDNAFAGCVNLNELSGGNNIQEMSGSAFADCPLQIAKNATQNQKGFTLGEFQLLKKDTQLLNQSAIFTFSKWALISGLAAIGLVCIIHKGNKKKLSA